MRSIWLLSLFTVLCSCATLGTHATLHHVADKNIHRVAVLIAQDVDQPQTGINDEYVLFTKVMAEELASRNLFRFTILDRTYAADSFDEQQINLMAHDLAGRYDAYLVCWPTNHGLDYRVQLKLIQTDPPATLITVAHATSMGNSYLWYQDSYGTLIDAVSGAMDGFQKRWTKMNAGMASADKKK